MSNIEESFAELENSNIERYGANDLEAYLKSIWDLGDYRLLKEAYASYAPKIEWGFGLSDSFNKHVQKLDAKLRGRILTCLIDIAKDPMTPRGNTIQPLEGDKKGLWRYREGDYRIIYYPDKSKSQVTIMDVDSRDEIYK
jgi:mRNA-degrading endonuclease RelE of RelBE toxin-antitoxin system